MHFHHVYAEIVTLAALHGGSYGIELSEGSEDHPDRSAFEISSTAADVYKKLKLGDRVLIDLRHRSSDGRGRAQVVILRENEETTLDLVTKFNISNLIKLDVLANSAYEKAKARK